MCFIFWSIGLIEVKGNTCSQPLGGCGPMGQCDQRCKALHIDGQGSCDLGLCTCYYGCADPPPSPTPPKMCNNGLGVCSVQCGDACCNAKCASKYNQGTGMCSTIGNNNLCTCQYRCGWSLCLIIYLANLSLTIRWDVCGISMSWINYNK